MNADEFDPPPEGATRLIADLAAVPEGPVGPHVDEELLFGLASGSLSATTEADALAHLASCPSCAERAAAASLAGVPPTKVHVPIGAAERALVEVMTLVAAVRVAARSPTARRSLVTRSIDWQDMSQEGLSCAVYEKPAGQPVFAVRSRTPEWAERPLRCAIRDIGANTMWAETWLVMHDESRSTGIACEAEVVLGAPLPLPKEWAARVSGCEFDAQHPLTMTDLEPLREVIAKAPARDRAAWRRWLDEEVNGSRLSDRDRRTLQGVT